MPDYESMLEDSGFNNMDDYLDEQAYYSDLKEERNLELFEIHELQELSYLKKCDKPVCNGTMILKVTKKPHKYFWSCTNYPKCRHTENFKNNQQLEAICPKCKSQLIIRFGNKGAFLGCTNYPKCKFNSKLPFSKLIKNDLYTNNISLEDLDNLLSKL